MQFTYFFPLFLKLFFKILIYFLKLIILISYINNNFYLALLKKILYLHPYHTQYFIYTIIIFGYIKIYDEKN